jgi:hypothetical protein
MGGHRRENYVADCTGSLDDGVTMGQFCDLIAHRCPEVEYVVPLARCLPARNNALDRGLFRGFDWRGRLFMTVDCTLQLAV